MGTLNGKKVLVTGGSRGIGAGIAQRLAKEGARVAITYTSRPEAAETIIKGLPGEGHVSLEMNISEESSIEEGINTVLETFNGLDGLVNNAGITSDQLLLRMKTEDFDKVIQTNLRGTFLCTKAVMKPMMKARNGSIVNLSSVIAQMGNPGQANYAASKGGLEAMTRSMALEMASRNIRMNCIAPGFIATEMTESLEIKQQEAIKERIPLGRMGTPEDIAALTAFLLSDGGSYITGQVIQVNGGLYM
ncbi:MAG: 3-oxoacyl-[acyl-carrier-protein] reductase [Bdellovibrionales bacterium]|nr:3-oxoacyl-[acyl-carrier-protein] reductase [Bdellovibrionales bacterium]